MYRIYLFSSNAAVNAPARSKKSHTLKAFVYLLPLFTQRRSSAVRWTEPLYRAIPVAFDPVNVLVEQLLRPPSARRQYVKLCTSRHGSERDVWLSLGVRP